MSKLEKLSESPSLESFLSPQALKSLRADQAAGLIQSSKANLNKPDYTSQGELTKLFEMQQDEILISGPAGTGKSRACLQRLDGFALQYNESRHLIVRKTKTSMAESALLTYERDVMGFEHPIVQGAQRRYRQQYRYPNGSEIIISGMDKPTKIMSTEFDSIYVQEAIELIEEDWESLTTRLRNGRMPFQQIISDTNPGSPTHWLKQRADIGTTELIASTHEDNPVLWDMRKAAWTERGEKYIERLNNLTGARKQRLRFGRWVQAEGVVYEDYNPAIHLIDRFDIPDDWRKFRVIDFGFNHPFVCQWWAINPDGDMFRYREIYMSGRTVANHSARIKELSTGERFESTVCDHDAEDRETLRENGIRNIPAKKDVSVGIDKLTERLLINPVTNKPRIFFMRDSLVELDRDLYERKAPTSTEQEFDGYIWRDLTNKEEPVKDNDHGMDATRYAVMYADKGLPTAKVYIIGKGYIDINE